MNTETGSSLRAHNLRILDTLLISTTRLIANRAAWADEEKRAKTENLAMLLRGALNAEQLVGLKMNVPSVGLDAVIASLPALRKPTVSPLSDSEWVALEIDRSRAALVRLGDERGYVVDALGIEQAVERLGAVQLTALGR